ncbi:MAG: TIGR02757 family protein [Acidobacteria bacterium 13_1_40CM_2_56_5]|nr:MAG: TIGR02757 family protein [Acidobacteria bacterium 13_1_40CM_2_56_5]
MSLKHHLDTFLDNFPKEKHLGSDPVQFVHRYQDPVDREIVGLIASVFAYGNVKIVLRTVNNVLSYLGPAPSRTIASFDPRKHSRRLRGFYHRFNTSRDLAVLFWIIRRALEEYGSLESVFVSALSPNDTDVTGALENFSGTLLGFGHERFYPRGELKRRVGVRFFFPAPSQGSACKRLNLYLRWMVRPEDGIDCGVWMRIKPRQLVIPLDTHIARISSYIGLTDMRSPGWPMALDITRSLRKLHCDDPLRYDFALCHLGIAGDCPKKRDLQKCARCPILAICRL